FVSKRRSMTSSRKRYIVARMDSPSGASAAATATPQIPPVFTTKLNVVVLSSGEPVTVIGYVPTAVELDAEISSLLEQVALHPVGVNVAVAPLGRPEIEKETLVVMPEIRVAVIVLLPDAPTFAVMFPELLRT